MSLHLQPDNLKVENSTDTDTWGTTVALNCSIIIVFFNEKEGK